MSGADVIDTNSPQDPFSNTDADGFLEDVKRQPLSNPVTDVVDEYEAVFGDRDQFLWKWIRSLFPAFELSSVAARLEDRVRTQKTLLTVFVTVLDDLAESRGDVATFQEARHLPFAPERVDFQRADADREVLRFLADLWETLIERVRAAPRYAEFADLFEYDLRQTLNAMEYSSLVSENLQMSNMRGYENYTPHNMCMFPYANLDLMHSPAFSKADLSAVRETIWDVQEMARMGNDLTTWVRELDEEDYSAGLVTYALEESIVTAEDVTTEDSEELVERIRGAGVEEVFVSEWWDRCEDVEARAPNAETVDLRALLEGMHTVMEYHLASEGHK